MKRSSCAARVINFMFGFISHCEIYRIPNRRRVLATLRTLHGRARTVSVWEIRGGGSDGINPSHWTEIGSVPLPIKRLVLDRRAAAVSQANTRRDVWSLEKSHTHYLHREAPSTYMEVMEFGPTAGRIKSGYLIGYVLIGIQLRANLQARPFAGERISQSEYSPGWSTITGMCNPLPAVLNAGGAARLSLPLLRKSTPRRRIIGIHSGMSRRKRFGCVRSAP